MGPTPLPIAAILDVPKKKYKMVGKMFEYSPYTVGTPATPAYDMPKTESMSIHTHPGPPPASPCGMLIIPTVSPATKSQIKSLLHVYSLVHAKNGKKENKKAFRPSLEQVHRFWISVVAFLFQVYLGVMTVAVGVDMP